MVKDVIIGYHPITKDEVNVWYTRENGHRMRVVGVNKGWMICDETNGSKWMDTCLYDHYIHAIEMYP